MDILNKTYAKHMVAIVLAWPSMIVIIWGIGTLALFLPQLAVFHLLHLAEFPPVAVIILGVAINAALFLSISGIGLLDKVEGFDNIHDLLPAYALLEVFMSAALMYVFPDIAQALTSTIN